MKKIFFLMALLLCSVASYAGKQAVYLYGFAASFNDSIVYFTDLQTIAQAEIDKHNFLYGREEYSNQLRDYLAAQGYSRRTKKNGAAPYTIKYLTPEEFSYTPVVAEKETSTK